MNDAVQCPAHGGHCTLSLSPKCPRAGPVHGDWSMGSSEGRDIPLEGPASRAFTRPEAQVDGQPGQEMESASSRIAISVRSTSSRAPS